ncbi:hypothetical protein ACFGVS_24380 [Mucilaginibacter sp. AW1-7]|uniref:hypothetical protein n=1 Tax=Mucilaginibacter sp. AW1-7 TaxID=3349874 RepID=UPI003F73A751
MKKHFTPLKQVDNQPGKIFFSILFFTGLASTIFEIHIYQKTFIPIYIPVSIYIISGVLSTPFFLNTLRQTLDGSGLLWQYVFNTISWGGVVAALFMAVNFNWGKGDISSVTLPILHSEHSYSNRNGCYSLNIKVEYEEVQKYLVFPCDTLNLKNLDVVILTLDKGLLGYDVIKSQKLLKKN